MKKITLVFSLVLLLLIILASASAQQVFNAPGRFPISASNKCEGLNAIRVPCVFTIGAGLTATAFTQTSFTRGRKCGIAGMADAWGYTLYGGPFPTLGPVIYRWYQWKRKDPQVVGGPLAGVILAPGIYTLMYDGGAGSVTLEFTVSGAAPPLPPCLKDG